MDSVHGDPFGKEKDSDAFDTEKEKASFAKENMEKARLILPMKTMKPIGASQANPTRAKEKDLARFLLQSWQVERGLRATLPATPRIAKEKQ